MYHKNLYLDNAATTSVHPEVVNSMLPYFENRFYNPSSLYSESKKIKEDINSARHTIADFINAKDHEIFFTSGGSESNSWAIQGFSKMCWKTGNPFVIIHSSIEHHSIIECCDNNSIVDSSDVVPVDAEGLIDIGLLENAVRNWSARTRMSVLVTIQLANNELGTIQNIKEIANIVHRYNGILHCDATQAFGHIPIDVKELGVDMMTASGHKIHAPKGIGLLYIKESLNIQPIIYGTQEGERRGGTENVPYIIGFAKAVELCKMYFEENRGYQARIRNYLWQKLRDTFGCTLNGSKTKRLPNNINITFPQNVTGEALIYMLNTSRIFISAGSACNSMSDKPSHVLKAIGLSDRDAMRTIRITLPDSYSDVSPYSYYDDKSNSEKIAIYNDKISYEDIDYFIDEISKILRLLDIDERMNKGE